MRGVNCVNILTYSFLIEGGLFEHEIKTNWRDDHAEAKVT